MPKHLFLCRHADSLSAVAGQKDFNRELSENGKQEAIKAAAWINNYNIPVDVIYASTATRTTQTARLLVQFLNSGQRQLFTEENLYNASAQTILKFIESLDPLVNTAVLVLHNPGVSDVLSLLQADQRYYVPTGGVNYIRLEESDWQMIKYSIIKLQISY